MVTRLIRLVLLLAMFATGIRAAEVTATLDRESVPAGEGAQFTIEIKDGDARPPQMPQVPDFVFQGPHRGRQMSFFNGQASSTTTFAYLVGSQKPGEYTIPAITLQVDGRQVQTQPLKLKVTPSANQQPQGLPQNNSAAGGSVPEDSELGFLTVELALKDRGHAWVGEIAPVRIKAWLPEGARANLRSNIQPEGSAYTLHNISPQPQQGQEVRDGKRFQTVTWYGGLSTTKAGKYAPDLTVKATVAVRDRTQRRRDPRDPFSDPFFDSVMGQFTQKDVDLKSHKGPEAAIEVRPLPKEGRPADFSGAVGKFKLDQSVLPDSWHTGEPQQLTAVVSGEGNFKLLRRPDLLPAENWKTYEGDSEFAARDVASFAGTQTFKWNAVPRKGGAQDARMSFSYFDPDTARYETVSGQPKHIAVAGADVKDEPVPVAADDAPKKAATDNLAPQHPSDTMVRSLTPLAFRPAFRPALYSAGGAVLLGLILGLLRSRKTDPQRKAREAAERAAHAALHEAESFAARGDVPGFFTAARRALQVRLSALWSRPAQAITLADVAMRVPGDSPVVRIFREADRIEYGRSIPSADDSLADWRTLLHDAMKFLTA